MSRVYWDSMVFIYLIEKNPTYFPIVKSVHEAMRRRGDTLCTSMFDVGEVLVGPRKLGSQSGVDRIRKYFAGGTLAILPFTFETAEQFALIRSWTGSSPSDAIHLAAAADAGVDVFLTNDTKLLSLRIPGIGTICDLDPAKLAHVLP
jgi:predicted nucleic acid-binding protein